MAVIFAGLTLFVLPVLYRAFPPGVKVVDNPEELQAGGAH
jgi:hypothetical protein